VKGLGFRSHVLFALLATVILVAGLARVEIDASIGTMLVSDDPRHAAHDIHKAWFGSDEVLSVAIPFRDALSLDSLVLQRQVVDGLETIEGVVQVTALVSQEDVVGDGESLDVLPLVPDDLSGWVGRDSRWLEGIRERVRSNPIWLGWLVSESLGAVAMQVRLDDSHEGELNRAQTMSQIDATLERILGDREYFLAGHPFMKSEITKSISSDLARLLPVSFLVMTFLLLLATRSLYVGSIAAFSVLLSVVWMVGAMGWLGLGMTALTNTAPTILVALSTAAFLHLTAAFQSAQASSSPGAATAAIGAIRRPMWIAAITTAAGYASLYLSSVPIVREFGLTLAVGMLGTGVVGTVFLPAMLSFAPRERRHRAFADGCGLGAVLLKSSRFVARAPTLILVVSVAFGVFMSIAATQIEVDSSGPKRFDEDSRFRRSARFYRKELSGDVLESVYLHGQPGAFLDPAVLRRMQAFQAAAEELPEVDRAVSLADHVARTYWVFRGEVGDPTELPDTSAAVAQLLLLYESSGDLGTIADYVSPDYDRVRIMLTADVQSSSVSAQLRRDLNAIATRFLPEHVDDYSVVSTEMLLSHAADVIAVEQVRSAALALVLVLGLVAISFRSLKAGATMILPNVLPLVTNLGLMSLVGLALSDATSIISATAIGIAVDSTVHILNCVRESERDLGSRRAAVLHAILTIGRPVIVTSLVVVVGFSFLLLSEFGSVAELGALTAMTMIYCLLADLFVLPALLLVSKNLSDECDPLLLEIDGRTIVGSRLSHGVGEGEVGVFLDGDTYRRVSVDEKIGSICALNARGSIYPLAAERRDRH